MLSVNVLLCLQAVENPSCTEIRDVLAAAGMNVYMEVTPENTHTHTHSL